MIDRYQKWAAFRAAQRVYFARRADGLIKIGVSATPEKRVRRLSWEYGCKHELLCVVPGGSDLENYIHRHFADASHSGEIFRPTERLMDTISAIQAGQFAEPVGPTRPHAPRAAVGRQSHITKRLRALAAQQAAA